MTILQSLDHYYDRMAARGEVAPPGFAPAPISFSLTLAEDGTPVDLGDRRVQKGKKLGPASLVVPAGVKRTAGIAPNLFWDKTAYVLGRTAGAGKRTAEEHAAFRAAHLDLLKDATDPGLVALRRFLEKWTPEQFETLPHHAEALDTNLVFNLDGETRYLHERPAALALLAAREGGGGADTFCLVTGRHAPAARLHPTIKGVDGAQTSGASLVSFNLEAFSSYGKSQGANAPTSELAAFRYGAALNRLLDRATSRTRIRIGDATVVFWAEADQVGEAAAEAAEDLFAEALDPEAAARRRGETDAEGAARIAVALAQVQKDRPVSELGLGLSEGTRFHILGLAPNAARLSVRFWLSDDFSEFARRLARHAAVTALEPRPSHWGAMPALQRLLVKTTAAQEKFENIPPALAGELTRAILSGGRYPRTLLSAALMRIRAGDDPATGWHAAAIRAVLLTNPAPGHPEPEKETPVSLDRDNPSPAYQLGRLFAVMETAQYFALGKVNATIRDRYFGAASATPASVFPLLLRNVQSHLGKLRKEHKGGWLEREITDIMDRLGPELPRSLPLEAQGRFVLGYYHQRRGAAAERPEAAEALTDMTSDTRTEDTSDDD
ncbi:type I-C CRISPR-associated protein Cas8c/Csd1 [Segnochrobactraceae bacterium EtOH-i3]